MYSSEEKSLFGKGRFRGESRERLLPLRRVFARCSFAFSLVGAAIAGFERSVRRISRGLFLLQIMVSKILENTASKSGNYPHKPPEKIIKESMEHVPRSSGDPSIRLKWRRLSLDLKVSAGAVT